MFFEKSREGSARRGQGYGGGLLVLLWISGCGGVFTGIPDLNTADGRVFAQRCGACHGQPFGDYGITHGVPDPRFRTMAEWERELSRMEGLMREKGIPSLTEADRDAIKRYLSRHAKS
jgi:mono/diheme cytochrome c family protein